MTKSHEILKRKKQFILDMDGTFYLGDRLLDGSLHFLEKAKATGRRCLFFTNNSSRTGEYYRKKLASMGCHVEKDEIATSGDVTIKYLLENYPGAGVYLVGTEMLRESFIDSGINLTCSNPDIVVFSFDTTLTYEKISRACTYIRNGAIFLATHPDLNCPTEDGFIPDCGSMCAMVEASTGVKPKYLGKPFKETVDMISLFTGKKREEIAFIGDRLYTDIAIAVNNGITGILVLTGETSLKDVEASQIKPDFIFDSLGALGDVL
ncbi:MAG: HAD-IIA family hydrolase [Acetivibrionales bacterium]|jgi:4-nitrophenyl phosphatase